MQIEACISDEPVVLLVGAAGLTACLSVVLKAHANWPQGLHLVDLAELAIAMPGRGTQGLSSLLDDAVRRGQVPVCTLLCTPPPGNASDAVSTQAWRLTLAEANCPHAVLHGDQGAQQAAALAAVTHAWARRQSGQVRKPSHKWRWICENCDDGDCEQHWLPGARKPAP